MGEVREYSFNRQKSFHTIYSVNLWIFVTLISVRLISLLYSFHGMNHKGILTDTVAQITVTIITHWFLTTQNFTQILMIFATLIFLSNNILYVTCRCG